MDRIEFVRDPLKTSLILFGGVALVIASLCMAFRGEDVVDRGMGWAGTLLFGAAIIRIFLSLGRGGPEFIFDSSGIRLEQSGIVIPWNEVEQFSIVRIRQSKFLSLKFRDPDQFLARVSAMRAAMARFNNLFGWGHWSLSFSGITPDIDVAMQFVERHRAGR